MKRISLVGAVGALLVALLAPTPAASAAVPEPDPRAESTATYEEVGTPDAADVKEALGWPEDHPMTVTNGKNPTTDPYEREFRGNPWIGEKVSNFRAYVSTDAYGDWSIKPDGLGTSMRQTTHLRDRDFTSLVNRLKAAPASTTTVVSSSATAITYIRRDPQDDDWPSAATVMKAGPNALVSASCYGVSLTSPTPAEATACTEPIADLLRERYVAGWPAISAHWPDPSRSLLLPSKKKMKDRLLTARQVHRIGGTKRWMRLNVTGHQPWRVHAYAINSSGSGPRWYATIDLLRTGDVPAARTELHDRYLRAKKKVVRADARSFTSFRSTTGQATTWRRVSTGLIGTSCWRRSTGSKTKAIRCSRRLSEAQADKAGYLFKR